MGITLKPAARTAATARAPGSETPGVPASVISATRLPAPSCATSLAAASFSLCWCSARVCALMPWWSSNWRAWRVSSQATRSTPRRVSRARSVMSPRFPIGVPTTYNALSMSGILAQSRGAAGEQLAADYLQRQGLKLIERNFRVRGGEIDLICRDGASTVFVEVRRRSRSDYGGAAASITAAKQRAPDPRRTPLAAAPRRAPLPLRLRADRGRGRRRKNRMAARCVFG
jgi:hypothetical protein